MKLHGKHYILEYDDTVLDVEVTVLFSDAAIMWASFYHLVFKAERKKITRNTMESAIRKVVDTFGVTFNCYSKSRRVNYLQKIMEPSIE